MLNLRHIYYHYYLSMLVAPIVINVKRNGRKRRRRRRRPFSSFPRETPKGSEEKLRVKLVIEIKIKLSSKYDILNEIW